MTKVVNNFKKGFAEQNSVYTLYNNTTQILYSLDIIHYTFFTYFRTISILKIKINVTPKGGDATTLCFPTERKEKRPTDW